MSTDHKRDPEIDALIAEAFCAISKCQSNMQASKEMRTYLETVVIRAYYVGKLSSLKERVTA